MPITQKFRYFFPVALAIAAVCVRAVEAGPLTGKIEIRGDETLLTTFVFLTIGSFDVVANYENKVTLLLGRALEYLGMSEEDVSLAYDRVVIIPNSIGPRGSTMGPGVKYDVHSPWEGVSWSPHEFIHDMVAPLTRSDRHKAPILPGRNGRAEGHE